MVKGSIIEYTKWRHMGNQNVGLDRYFAPCLFNSLVFHGECVAIGVRHPWRTVIATPSYSKPESTSSSASVK
ncbi:hypothetical protein VDG1235_1985 [Verrucomicrobiia bacterium DG1235]|nr:hypothetical protein VDG1235_1985 [Verrucomicrobiae bacterium DG1235]